MPKSIVTLTHQWANGTFGTERSIWSPIMYTLTPHRSFVNSPPEHLQDLQESGLTPPDFASFGPQVYSLSPEHMVPKFKSPCPEGFSPLAGAKEEENG